jgi:iron complex outermembrane recepter protein
MVTNVGRSMRLGIGLAVIAGLVVPSASWGQAAKAKKAAAAGPKIETEIEEITVTAQKREENIQEIPISVTAVTGAALEAKGVVNVSDLVQSVPNLRINEANGGNSSFVIAMRGTANGDGSLSQSPTVGLHVDGVYIAKIQGANMDLEDLDRVEVLRGPQGTLFGRNTTGGAINLITKKPTDERSVTVSTQVGNYDAFKGRVTVNVPLIGKNGFWQSDALGTLSLRENVSYRSHEPYVDNKSPTNVKESGGAGMSNVNRVFNMISLRWQPNKDITVDYAFEYHRYRESMSATQVSYIHPLGLADANYEVAPGFIIPNPLIPGGLVPYLRPNRENSYGMNSVMANDLSLHRVNDDGNHRMHFLTAAWDLGQVGPLGNVTLKSITGYRSMTLDNNIDDDGSPLHVADFHLHDNLDTWSEEVQWIGSAPRTHYVMGLYYYGEHTTEVSEQVLFGGVANFYFINTGKTSSYAPFGQVTYTPPILSDKLSITAGLRYTLEHVGMHRHFQDLQDPRNDFNYSVAKGFGVHGNALPGLSPMGNIAYQWTDNVMSYFRVSRGFQSGGVNGRATEPALFNKMFDPEKLWSYEGGMKSQWLDNRLRFNADGFLSRYTDQVVTVFRGSATGGAVSSLENAGESEIWGFEMEAVALPVRGVEATLNYSYLNSKYTKWSAQKYDAQGQPVWLNPCGPGGAPGVNCNTQASMENVANQRDYPVAPDHNISVGLTYTAPPMSAGVFSAHVDAYWQDSTVFHPVRPQPDMAGNYAVFNGRLQLVDIPLQKGSLDLAVYGRNLANRQYRVMGFDLGALGWAVNTFGDARTFGLQMTYNFTAS